MSISDEDLEAFKARMGRWNSVLESVMPLLQTVALLVFGLVLLAFTLTAMFSIGLHIIGVIGKW